MILTLSIVLVIASLLMAAAGYFGPQVYERQLVEFVGYPEIVGTYNIRDLWVPIILVAFSVAHLPGCVKHVVQAQA